MLSVFFLFFWSGFSPLPLFGKVLLLLGSVCAINFRERTFVFALFLGPCVFVMDLPMVFAYFLAISPRKCFKKILLMSGLVFLSRSLCLRIWVDDVFCCFSSFSFFLDEIELRANRTPHSPPHVLLFFFLFLFLSPPLCLVRLFWPCVLFVLVFLGGAILGPVRFLDSLETALRPFFFGREAVEACALFLVCCFSRFAASHVSSGPCAWSQEGRPACRLARSSCPSEGKGSIAVLGRRDSDPLLFVSFVLLVFVLGHRDPRALLFVGAPLLAPRRLSHARFFFQGFSLSLSLSFSCLIGLRGPRHDGSANVAQIYRVRK